LKENRIRPEIPWFEVRHHRWSPKLSGWPKKDAGLGESHMRAKKRMSN